VSAGTCPRCGGDGRLIGRHVRVGSYLMVCALCRGTGNVPPSGVGGSGARFRAWWHRTYVRLFYRPISRMVRRFSDALDGLDVDE
jgi:hypothetical protein